MFPPRPAHVPALPNFFIHYGIYLNLAKCEIVGSDPVADFPEMRRIAWDDVVHLGVHCGRPGPSRSAFVDRIVEQAATQIAAFAAVASHDPLAGLTLLRMCGLRAALNFHLRAMGPDPGWQRVEDCLTIHAETFVATLPSAEARQQCALPLRFGGFGLCDITTIAPTAHAAAVLTARAIIPMIPAEWAVTAAADPSLAPFPTVTAAMLAGITQEAPVVRGQRTWTSLMNAAMLEDLVAKASLTDKARLSSLQAKTTSLWLSPTPASCDARVWMAPALFPTAARLRLGAPVRELPAPCLRCAERKGIMTNRDLYGHHSLCCMIGGSRCLLHNAVVNQLVADAAFGMLHPVREARVFTDSPRMDITIRTGRREQLVDVAFSCPFRETGNCLAKAAETPGGWATAYEATKVARYGHLLGPTQDLIPCVFDTFGAAGATARPFLARVAGAFQRRLGERTGRLVFFTRLMTLIVSKVAELVVSEA